MKKFLLGLILILSFQVGAQALERSRYYTSRVYTEESVSTVNLKFYVNSAGEISVINKDESIQKYEKSSVVNLENTTIYTTDNKVGDDYFYQKFIFTKKCGVITLNVLVTLKEPGQDTVFLNLHGLVE